MNFPSTLTDAADIRRPTSDVRPPTSDLSPIPREAWVAHALTKNVTTFPDGTPLDWNADSVLLFERMTGSLLWPQDTSEAFLFLWAASLTPAQHEALWQAPLPVDEPDADAPPAVRPAIDGEQLRTLARAWYRTVIPAGASIYAFNLAVAVWNWHNAAAVEVDTDALPDDQQPDDTEKKNPAAAPTGSPVPSTPSATETPPAGPPSAGSHGAPSSPPMAHGSTATDSPSSPPPPDPAGTASSMTSSPESDLRPLTSDF